MGTANVNWTRSGISGYPLRGAGFTLIELLIVVSVAAVLLTVAVPSFRFVTNSNRVASEMNGLVGDMQYARMEAVKEGWPVSICSSTTSTGCANSVSWDAGWIVFADVNGNEIVDAGEPILRTQRRLQHGDTLTADNALTAVTFNRDGFAVGLPGTVTLTLHDQTVDSHWTRCLAISIVGVLTAQNAGQGNCL